MKKAILILSALVILFVAAGQRQVKRAAWYYTTSYAGDKAQYGEPLQLNEDNFEQMRHGVVKLTDGVFVSRWANWTHVSGQCELQNKTQGNMQVTVILNVNGTGHILTRSNEPLNSFSIVVPPGDMTIEVLHYRDAQMGVRCNLLFERV